MSDMIEISKKDLDKLEKRAKKLAQEKSYLELVSYMMSKLSIIQGLDEMVDSLLELLFNSIGGTSVSIYYNFEDHYQYVDIFGKREPVSTIKDEMIQKVIETNKFTTIENDFEKTKMKTKEFSKSWSWVFPLKTNDGIIGVIKMENIPINPDDIGNYLSVFFDYSAAILSNEILGYSKLKDAYDRIEKFNEHLIDREMRVVEVKKEVNDLCLQLGKKERYASAMELDKVKSNH